MTSFKTRLAALEVPARHCGSAGTMSDAELEAIVAPLFGGRVPTDAELIALLEGGPKGQWKEEHEAP